MQSQRSQRLCLVERSSNLALRWSAAAQQQLFAVLHSARVGTEVGGEREARRWECSTKKYKPAKRNSQSRTRFMHLTNYRQVAVTHFPSAFPHHLEVYVSYSLSACGLFSREQRLSRLLKLCPHRLALAQTLRQRLSLDVVTSLTVDGLFFAVGGLTALN
jgi:hypothetical protein